MPRTFVSNFIMIKKFVIVINFLNHVPVLIKTSSLSVYYLCSKLVLLLSALPNDKNINGAEYNFKKTVESNVF